MKELPKLKPYLKKLDYSYTFGIYPTLDLFKYKPDKALKVILQSDSLESEGIKEILLECKKLGVEYEINDRAIEKIAAKENTYAIGIFQKYEIELKTSENHIVLVEPKNLGNIGTIIRTMVGMGFNDLVLIRPAADIFDPKVVRSAMGALFQTRFAYFDTFEQYKGYYNSRNFYPFMLEGGADIRGMQLDAPYSLIFGPEGSGLSSEFSAVGQPIFISTGGNRFLQSFSFCGDWDVGGGACEIKMIK